MLKNYGRLRESLEMSSATLPSSSLLRVSLDDRSALTHARASFLSTPLLSLNQQRGVNESILQSIDSSDGEGHEDLEEGEEEEEEDDETEEREEREAKHEEDEDELFVSIAPSSAATVNLPLPSSRRRNRYRQDSQAESDACDDDAAEMRRSEEEKVSQG
jgi:ABC-type Zn2+ transport system substrate-binding protein/surface adhesin